MITQPEKLQAINPTQPWEANARAMLSEVSLVPKGGHSVVMSGEWMRFGHLLCCLNDMPLEIPVGWGFSWVRRVQLTIDVTQLGANTSLPGPLIPGPHFFEFCFSQVLENNRRYSQMLPMWRLWHFDSQIHLRFFSLSKQGFTLDSLECRFQGFFWDPGKTR